MKTLNKYTVHEVVDGEEVVVFCPKRLVWLPCVVAEFDAERIYINTQDSCVAEYNAYPSSDEEYGDCVQHLRFNNCPERGSDAVMSRGDMAKLLHKRSYVIC